MTPETAIDIDIPARSRQTPSMIRWIVAAGVVAALGVTAWFYANQNPLRTVPELSVRDFLENPTPYVGQTVKAELSVVGELGNTPGKGRLMIFSDSKSSQRIAIMIPPELDTQIFSKNQKYLIKLRIEKGGLAYADYLSKI